MTIYPYRENLRGAEQMIETMRRASVPQKMDRLFFLAGLTENSLNFVTDVMKSMLRFGPHHRWVQNLGLPTGVLWSLSSGRELMAGWGDLNEINDQEGIQRARARVVVGFFAFSAALMNLAGRVSLTSRILPILSDACLGIHLFLGSAVYCLGAIRCHHFRNELENAENSTHFLAKFFQKESIEIQVKYLKRRTSVRSVQKLIDRIDPILKNLKEPEWRKKGVDLIEEIRSDNMWKEFLFAAGSMASSTALLGLVLVSFTSLGAVSYMVQGVSSALFLLITIYFLAAQVLGYTSLSAL